MLSFVFSFASCFDLGFTFAICGFCFFPYIDKLLALHMIVSTMGPRKAVC